MAFSRTKFQIFSLLVSNKNKYNLFLRQQAWHCASARPVLCSKKNINEDNYDDNKESSTATSKTSERYGKRKKMRFLNFRKTPSTKERSRIINYKAQNHPERKLTFWEYVFGPKKSLSNPCRVVYRQRQTRRKENPRLCDSRHQATTGNIIYIEPVKSSRNSKNLKSQSSPMYKVPRAVLLNRMILDGFDENINKCKGKTITFTMTRRPYDEMKPPSNLRKIVELRRDVKLEDNEKSMPQISTQISADEACDSMAKISAMKQEKPRRLSRIEQLETLVNEKKFKRASRINPDSEKSNK
ncbi:uncharacterized protein LOC105256464 isoform X1 [Camponotus floridanus]|uniref:uncharacterized protein LOC105256464 isoform X1 n=1 Tax=Camponotus floridanus TaxID=104421 RepID=UPI00059E8FC8|nr:uncharacterized protein LOC105256464 isoform X1 [Camponotus floridanus]